MTFTNYGKNQLALLFGGSTTSIPGFMLIGSGSGITAVTNGSLINGVDSQTFTSTTYPTAYKVKRQADWNSVEMSGTQLREFGQSTGSNISGAVWTRTNIPAITFDGTNELRIEEAILIY
jgi:hypothetical protein